MKPFAIGRKTIGNGHKCFVIGEVAQAHDGSLGMAHAYIDVIADAGADAVKFQTHIAAEESTVDEPWRIRFSTQDKSRFDYWKRMEFTEEQWAGLKRHADDKNLIFLSSPFSVKAVELLEKIDVPAWKIASGEITDFPLLEKVMKTGKPVLISTGMSDLQEIDHTVAYIKKHTNDIAVMQCSTIYPCPPESVGLNLIDEFRQRYDCLAGLSDHSGTIYPSLAAASTGANLVEIHVTLSRESFGPDVPASLVPGELKQLVTGVESIHKMRTHKVDKHKAIEKASDLRFMFFKGLVAKQDLAAGDELTPEHIASRKPSQGISASHYHEIIGRKMNKNLKKDEPINWSDLE